MQNQYNNYLKRQKQQPINNFKEKVRNSLSGKTVNNTTMPNTAQAKIQNKVKAMTPTTGMSTNTIGTGSVSGVSTPVQTPNNINSRAITPNVSQTPLNASETPSVIDTPVVENQIEPTNIEGGAGLMSLSDVNNAIQAPKTRAATNPNARSTNNNYKDLLEQNRLDQIEQANKNWQIQEEAFKQQMGVLNGQYEQSKADAENAYNDSVNKLNENRYNQMEDLNVSGTNRGIQYSPQQLGLENVANINHNKNLAETSKQRNELLNKLQIEMNNSLAQLNMTMVNARNEYNKNILDINTNYSNTLMNWNREDALTQDSRDWEQKLLEEKRKWEEAQAQKDKEFQQMMQNMQNQFDKDQQNSQNNWQSNENALDRNHDKEMAKKSRSGGGGYSGYSSRGYSGYSRSYNPYSRGYYNGYQSYDGGMPDVNSSYLDDEIAQQAVDNNFKRLSTDAYNAVDSGGMYDLMERASFYDDFTSPMYNAYYGLNKTVDERLDNTRETALKHMFNKSYARSTNGTYKIGDTVYENKAPLRKDYIEKTKANKERTKSKFLDKYSKNEKAKKETRLKASAESLHEKVMDKNYKSKYASTEKKENKTVKRPNKITTKYQTASERVKSSAKNKSTTKIPKKPSTEKKKYQTSAQKVASAKNSSKKTTTKKVDFKSSAKKTTNSSSKKKYTTSSSRISSNNKKTTTKKTSFLDKVKKKLFKK